jgi:hypothetical protein
MGALNESVGLCRQFGWCGVLTLGLATAGAVAAGPPVRIEWAVNGGELNVYWPTGASLGLGVYGYDGALTDKATGIELGYELTADPYASIGGAFDLYNHTDGVIDLEVEVILPFTPVFVDGSELRGDVTIGLTTDLGGGMVGSQPPYLWQAIIDGVAVGPSASLFYDPFFMSAGGQASLSTHADFGYPTPVAGPPVSSSIGYSLGFALTSLDFTRITSNFLSSGDALTCDGDLNTNGSVGTEDLYVLLTAWGPCRSPICPADLDGDVAVGITDMLIMLESWGPCQ